MKRVRFSKKEIEVMIQAMIMVAGDFDEGTIKGMTPHQAYLVYEKALDKLYHLRNRKEVTSPSPQ